MPEITVLTDYRTLVDGLHDHSVCETEDGTPDPGVHRTTTVL